MLAYHETVQFVKKWVDDANEDGTPTLMISVSDHETGGLALGRQLTAAYPEYAWYPDALANATQSTSYLGTKIADADAEDVTRDWLISEIYERGLGITDVTDEELDIIWPHRTNAYRANRDLADAVSLRALRIYHLATNHFLSWRAKRSAAALRSGGPQRVIPAWM